MDSIRVVNSNVSITNIVSFEKNKLINVLDFSGKSLIGKSSNPQIHIYENGFVEKKIIIE